MLAQIGYDNNTVSNNVDGNRHVVHDMDVVDSDANESQSNNNCSFFICKNLYYFKW